MNHSLQAVAKAAGARLLGDDGRRLSGIASIQSATAGDLVFVEDPKKLAAALASGAGAVLAGEFAAQAHADKPLLIATQPRLSFVRAAHLLVPRPSAAPDVHAAAVVSASARLGEAVAVAAHAVIEDAAEIGARTRIGLGAFVGRGVKIGSDCDLGPRVTVNPQVTIGNRVFVQAGSVLGSDGFGYVRDEQTGRYEKFPQVGGLAIGDDVEIGANCTIDRGALDATIISRGVKLDNMVHIAHNVFIGEDVVIAAQTGISGSVVIEKDVVIAGQVGIADHVRVEEGAILGAQCGVPSSKVIRGPGVLFWGTPARPIRQYLKELAVLARMAKKS
jgi:UDP-3-O-[3-hydroxymyristoyl] glucosamine N-acyltransferase